MALHGSALPIDLEWDEGDYQRLMEVKQGEMRSAGLGHPLDTAVRKAISRDELLGLPVPDQGSRTDHFSSGSIAAVFLTCH